MRKANVKLKNRSGEEIIYSDVSKIELETDGAEKAIFSFGNMANGIIDLDFSNGDQEVESPDDKLYTHITILKPEEFKPENIAEGVEIAGVIGTFQGAGYKPKLRTLTKSRSGNTQTISNPSSNGTLVEN